VARTRTWAIIALGGALSASAWRSPAPSRDEITLDELTRQMAGGSELDDWRHELENRAL